MRVAPLDKYGIVISPFGASLFRDVRITCKSDKYLIKSVTSHVGELLPPDDEVLVEYVTILQSPHVYTNIQRTYSVALDCVPVERIIISDNEIGFSGGYDFSV